MARRQSDWSKPCVVKESVGPRLSARSTPRDFLIDDCAVRGCVECGHGAISAAETPPLQRLLDYFANMKTEAAVDALSALAQSTRLEVFRLLVRRGPDGARPGEIAAALGLVPATLSFHLSALRHAGLVHCENAGRERIYSAAFAQMHALVDYLTENCCGGEDCRPKDAREQA